MTELISMSLLVVFALCAGMALGYAIATYDRNP
jgi:uncharacterized protein YneF (UPF0154 family)